MSNYPRFGDYVIINKEIKYTQCGTEYKTYDGQEAFVKDNYDEENDELYINLVDDYSILSEGIIIKLEDIYWPNE